MSRLFSSLLSRPDRADVDTESAKLQNDLGSTYRDSTRELYQLFKQYDHGKGVLNQQQIRSGLNQIGLYPSKSQVYEMVQCACESVGRKPMDHITFGEFSILVKELQEQYRKGVTAPVPRCKLKEKENDHRRGHRGRIAVFLGGSCNPTTWRHDIAIPHLKEHGITFYNPQVINWKPDLIEIEDQAKQIAELLFFVIDNQTRSAASVVEAAYLAGCGRPLILVIKEFTGPGIKIQGEEISLQEYEDLHRSHVFLTDLVERRNIPVFTNIHTALDCIIKVTKQEKKVEDLTLEDGAQPVKHAHLRVGDKLIKLRESFQTMDTSNSSLLSAKDVCLAYKSVTSETLDPAQIQNMKHSKDDLFTFEEFCCIVAEFKQRERTPLKRFLYNLIRGPSRLLAWAQGNLDSNGNGDMHTRKRDVFLGGSCRSISTWREDIAVPILRKHAISYFNPQLSEWSTRHIPLEASVKENCRLLLFVISEGTRATSSMLEVGHYIGMGCNIVLCIRNMQPGVVIEGEELTDLAIKDYNRGRTYLMDLANRERVPVFEDIKEAVLCVVQKLKEAPP